jgi:hypothetical protein
MAVGLVDPRILMEWPAQGLDLDPEIHPIPVVLTE